MPCDGVEIYSHGTNLTHLIIDLKGPFTLSDCDCESDFANNYVLLVSTELFTSSDVKEENEISRPFSRVNDVNGPSFLGTFKMFYKYIPVFLPIHPTVPCMDLFQFCGIKFLWIFLKIYIS